jgi:hypothetical protein
MASTYSALKIELIATGEQSGTWGTTTNNNLGDTALGEAITGSADVAFTGADVTVTLTDTNASQAARNLRLHLTGTSGGARQLILGAGCQIEKLYLISNSLADAVTVKNTSGTGVVVPANRTMFVYNNGTNVIDVVTHSTALSLTNPLPVSSGGTGSATEAGAGFALKNANSDITSLSGLTTPLSIAQGGTGAATLRAANIATTGYTTTATSASTTTLTATSTSIQFFTGVTTQTIVLPVASTMTQGQQFTIHNNSTGSLTVNSSGANLVVTITASTTFVITCILTSGTDALSWDADFEGFNTALTTERGGTNLTTIGTANQVLATNAGATGLAYTKVGIANLSATGTASNTTFLRGDNTWGTPTGGLTQGSGITGGWTNTSILYPSATYTSPNVTYAFTSGIVGSGDFQCVAVATASGNETYTDASNSTILRWHSVSSAENCARFNCNCACNC